MPHPSPEATERTQRHLRMCQELAELGMQLARAAAAQALATQTPPEKTDAEPDAAPSAAPTMAPSVMLFTKISHAVRQAILLETRIAADHAATLRGAPTQTRDMRRDFLREVLHRAAADHPDGLDFKREAYERLDDELANDRVASTTDLMARISESLGIVITEAHLPAHASRHMWPTITPRTPRETTHRPTPQYARRT